LRQQKHVIGHIVYVTGKNNTKRTEICIGITHYNIKNV